MSLLSAIKGIFKNNTKDGVQIYQDKKDPRITRIKVPNGADFYQGVKEHIAQEEKLLQMSEAVEMAAMIIHQALLSKGAAQDNGDSFVATVHQFLSVSEDGSFPLIEPIIDCTDMDDDSTPLHQAVSVYFHYQEKIKHQAEPFMTVKKALLAKLEKIGKA